MKTFLNATARAALLLFVIIFCTACPYESYYPLTGEAIEYSPYFKGTFKNEMDKLQITAKNSRYVYFNYEDALDETEIKGTGYITTIDKTNFAVLTKRDNGKFLIYKIVDIDRSGFTVRELSDKGKIENQSFKSSKAIEKFIRQNSDAFSAPIVWKKQ